MSYSGSVPVVPPLCEAEPIGTLNMDCACSICFQPPPLSNARMVFPCNHLFCGSCLDQALAKKQECPLDRVPIDGVQVRVVSADEESLAQIRNVPVQCSSKRLGCTWEGSWEMWCHDQHATTCPYRSSYEIPCGVPGCSSSSGSGEGHGESVCHEPTQHSREHLFNHVALLASNNRSLEAENRKLRVDLDQLKEGLYAIQNDFASWQHQSAREREEQLLTAQQTERDLSVMWEDARNAYPCFHVPSIHGKLSVSSSTVPCPSPSGRISSSSGGDQSSLVWDERCISRNATIVDGGIVLQNSGKQRGWATAFSKSSVSVYRNQPSVVQSIQFHILPPGEGDAQSASNVLPFQSSMLMIGLAVCRHTRIPSSSHAGSISGCWALQASGFVWDGDAKLCGKLQGVTENDDDCSFGVDDEIALELTGGPDACVIQCIKNRTTRLGIGAVVPFSEGRNVIKLFPIVSIGAVMCRVQLSR